MEELEIEKYVINSLYIYGEKLAIELDGLLSIECFKEEIYQVLYRIISTAIDNEMDIDYPAIIAVARQLKLNEYITEHSDEIKDILDNRSITLKNAIVYGKDLYKLKTIRSSCALLKQAYDRVRRLNEKSSIDEILNITESPGYEILNQIHDGKDDKPVNLGEFAESCIEEVIENPIKMVGIPTPFPKFNRAIGGGMRKGGITLIGAPAGNGKSLFSKETATFLSKTIPVLYIDTEMDPEEQSHRAISSLSGVSIEKVETGQLTSDEITKVRQAYNVLKTQKFYHRCVGGMEFEEILSTIKRWIYQDVGLDEDGKANDCLVIYDYFKLMSTKEVEKMKEYEAIGYNASRLTDFSKTLSFAVLAFVQLNRENNVAQSQRLEWFAKSVNFLFKKTADEIKQYPNCGNGKLITNMAKQRYNHNAMMPGDYINLFVDPDKSTMVEGPTLFEVEEQVNDNEVDDEEVIF